jgi:tryptophan halogenase
MKSCGVASSLEKYSIATMAARNNKFTRPLKINGSPLSDFGYAFQFDAGRYAQFLRHYAESRGVVRTEGKIASVDLCENSGDIKSLTLVGGKVLSGDLFIDCTGMRGLLIQDALKTGYEDWSHWLPCNSAVAAPCEKVEEPIPYTRSTAHSAGWQWRIPLQHRTGNGHVYSNQYMSDDEATSVLLKNLDGAVIAEPRVIRFQTGRRTKFWNKNCVAIGLSSGFLEPLESTSIHLIQTAISKLINLFPSRRFMQDGAELYNKTTIFEYERIRDFLILHYKATERTDSDFWNYCRGMEIPEYLREKIKLYKSSGRIYRENEELFSIPSWLAVFDGQGIVAEDYHPAIDSMSMDELKEKFRNYEMILNKCVAYMPYHTEYIAENCKAEKIN